MQNVDTNKKTKGGRHSLVLLFENQGFSDILKMVYAKIFDVKPLVLTAREKQETISLVNELAFDETTPHYFADPTEVVSLQRFAPYVFEKGKEALLERINTL